MNKKNQLWTSLGLAGMLLLLLLSTGLPVRAARLPAITPSLTPAPTAIPVAVLSPRPGQAVQGVVPVMVNTVVEGFLSGELYFGYAGDTTGTWFLIGQQDTALSEAAFANWDTTMITDGNYTLRLVVTARGQDPVLVLVEGLRVRNYSPVETDTPTPSPISQPGEPPTPTLTLTPSPTSIPLTPTPLPTNPAIVSTAQFSRSAALGALAAVGAVGLLGAYLAARQGMRKR